MSTRKQLEKELRSVGKHLLEDLAEEAEKLGVKYKIDSDRMHAEPEDKEKARGVQFGTLVNGGAPTPYWSRLIEKWKENNRVKGN